MSKEINLVNVDYRFKRNGKAYIGDADDAEALLRGTLRKKPAKF